MDTKKIQINKLSISNGTCEQDGWYVRREDLEKNNLANKKYFKNGEEFPSGEWCQIPGETIDQG